MWDAAWQYVRGIYPAMPRSAVQWWRRLGAADVETRVAGTAPMLNSTRPTTVDSACRTAGTESAVKMPASKSRMLLWVDAVGGFFICLGSEVRIGQAVPDSQVELPLLADLSRHHATIRRDEEGYTIEPVRDVRLNHQRLETTSWLNDGSLIELGPALQLRFSRPHPLSATARLDFVSNHRTQPSAAAVILMADTCVLGPGAQNHVVCRHLTQDVVLYRQHGGLYCRSAGPLEIDGKWYEQQGPLSLHSHVAGEQFSFGLEEI
jgi:hypothetical protein